MSFLTRLKDFFLTADRDAPSDSFLYPHHAGFSSAAAQKHGSAHEKSAGAGKIHDDDDEIADLLNPLSHLKSANQTEQTDVMTDTGFSENSPSIDLTDASRIENYVAYEASPLYIRHKMGIASNVHIAESDSLNCSYSYTDPCCDFTGSGTGGLPGMDTFGTSSDFGSSSGFGSDPF